MYFSQGIRFDSPIGAPVLVPVLPDAVLGYPDWRLDTMVAGDRYALQLGTGIVKPAWNFVKLGSAGNLDYRVDLGSVGEPQWRLVLVPEPSTTLLVGLGLIGVVSRARRAPKP